MELDDNDRTFLNRKKGDSRIKDSSIKHYKNNIISLKKYFNKPIVDITYEEFVDYIKGFKKWTSNSKIIFLKSYYRVLELPLGEFKHLKSCKPRINHTEYKKNLIKLEDYNALQNVISKPRDKSLIELLYHTGFRSSEITSIKYGGIEVLKDKIYVSCSKSKTNEREFPIFDELVHTQNYIRIYHPTKKKDDFLFLTLNNGKYTQMSSYNLNALLNKYCSYANIKHHKPHDFRHTRASILCKKGLPDAVIKKLMGWSDTSGMLSNYNHNGTRDYEDIIKGSIKPSKTYDQLKEENDELKVVVDNHKIKIKKLETMIRALGIIEHNKKLFRVFDFEDHFSYWEPCFVSNEDEARYCYDFDFKKFKFEDIKDLRNHELVFDKYTGRKFIRFIG